MNKIIYVYVFLLALTGCKEKSLEAMSVSDSAMELPPPPSPSGGSANTKDNIVSQDNKNNPDYTTEKIIKNADIRFETSDLKATSAQIKKALTKYKAHIQNETESNNDYTLNYTITVRIPSAHFDSFIDDIGKGVSYFDKKEISSQDVTEEYVDVEARIKAKKVLEARYLKLIERAVKVSEILEIEKELSAIREEIESQQGRLRYMQSRVALSTVNIEFYKQIANEPGATVSYGSKMGNALKSGFNSLSGLFIDLLYVWPFILIFVIVFRIVRKKFRKEKNKNV